jgi:hypothetical protein
MNKEIKVKTNMGNLIAVEGGDIDYPAIQVFLETKKGRTLLNVTEVNQVDENENILETYIYEDFNDDNVEPERSLYKNIQI